jgi:hypothetical protein
MPSSTVVYDLSFLRQFPQGQVRTIAQFVKSLAQRNFDDVSAKEAYGKCGAPRGIRQAFAEAKNWAFSWRNPREAHQIEFGFLGVMQTSKSGQGEGGVGEPMYCRTLIG